MKIKFREAIDLEQFNQSVKNLAQRLKVSEAVLADQIIEDIREKSKFVKEQTSVIENMVD